MPSPARLGALAAAVCLLAPAARAQSDGLWSDVAARAALGTATVRTTASRALTLDRAAMAARLAGAPLEAALGRGVAAGVDVPVPMPDGGTMWFRVAESPVMDPALQARYPEIRTYLGQGVDVPSATARFSLTPAGFAAMATTPSGTVYVDPYARTTADTYLAYYAADAVPTDAQRAARAAEVLLDGPDGGSPAARAAPTTANGATFRSYRLAMAATGEYTAFHGGTVAGALAAIVTTMNRVNQVYERDLSVRMVLVPNTDQIIYTDAATDPYTNTDADLQANQTTIDAVIGPAKYDIGHLVGTGGGGVASLGVVCSLSKANGLTGSPVPVGDAFDIDYVAHEMGHQFRGNHTFNGNASNCGGGNRNQATSYEPGSGSTVMAYAGICGATNDLQPNSDPLFHAISLQELVAFTQTGTGSTCGTATATGNDIPVVTAPTGLTIPVRTPFTLTGAATDATPAALTFIWEEFDRGASPGSAPAANGVPTGPPFFRSFVPTASPSRTFPQLNRLVAGQNPVRGEALPADGRTLTFRLTARDNRAGGGAIGDVTVSVVTDAGAGPFVITSPAAAGTVAGGSAQTVTWDVANTDVLDDLGEPDLDRVDVETVDVRYSADNGATFATLLAGAPNTGSASVVVPNAATSTGRFMVAAVGNVFFAVTRFNTAVTPVTAAEDGLRRASEGLSAVAPNPTSGTASFTLRTASAAPVAVAVYDALGRRVAVVHDGPVAAEQAFSVDVSALPAGVYVVRASGGVAASRRFTVVR